MNDAKSMLVIIRQTPYGTSLGRSAVELALSAVTFDQKVAVLFSGNGVLQLMPEQMSEAIEVRNVGKLINSFPLYELDQVFVDASALSEFGLNERELAIAVRCVDTQAIHDLLDQYDHILGF
jgi:tRNA 2-thiouridine synthesizing protein C